MEFLPERPDVHECNHLDAVHVDVVGDEKVVCVLEKIEHLVGSKFATARRVTGFEEGWIKFMYQGNEIAPELCWKDFGADGEKQLSASFSRKSSLKVRNQLDVLVAENHPLNHSG